MSSIFKLLYQNDCSMQPKNIKYITSQVENIIYKLFWFKESSNDINIVYTAYNRILVKVYYNILKIYLYLSFVSVTHYDLMNQYG